MNLSESKRTVDEQGVCTVNLLTACMRDRSWKLANDLLDMTNMETEDLAILVTLLAGTKRMPSVHLPSRPKFFLEVFKRYEADKGFKEAKFALLHLQ